MRTQIDGNRHRAARDLQALKRQGQAERDLLAPAVADVLGPVGHRHAGDVAHRSAVEQGALKLLHWFL